MIKPTFRIMKGEEVYSYHYELWEAKSQMIWLNNEPRFAEMYITEFDNNNWVRVSRDRLDKIWANQGDLK